MGQIVIKGLKLLEVEMKLLSKICPCMRVGLTLRDPTVISGQAISTNTEENRDVWDTNFPTHNYSTSGMSLLYCLQFLYYMLKWRPGVHFTQSSHRDGLWIHSNPDQNEADSEDKWKNNLLPVSIQYGFKSFSLLANIWQDHLRIKSPDDKKNTLDCRASVPGVKVYSILIIIGTNLLVLAGRRCVGWLKVWKECQM